MNLNDFRQKYPQYEKVPDQQLADGLYKKFYSSIPREQFDKQIGFNAAPQAQPMPQQVTPTQQAPMAPQKPQNPNLISRIAQDVKNREQTGEKIMTTPGQNPASVGLQMAGKVVAGTAGDIAGEVGKSAWDMLPDSIKNNIKNDPITKAAVMGAQKVGDVYGAIANSDFMKKHPEALANMESLKDIAAFLPMGKAAGATQKIAGEATGLAPIARGIAAPNKAKQEIILDAMHQKATATIENIKNSGVKFKPDITKKLVADLDTHPDLGTEGERAVRSETSATMDALKDSVQKGDNSVRNLIGFRDKFTQIIGAGGQDGNAALKAQQLLDKTLDKIPEFKKFQKEWGMTKLGQDVSAATQLADVSPAKSRAAFQKIVDSNYFKSFDTKTQDLLRTAAKGKASGKFMDVIGKLKMLGGSSIPGLGKMLPGMELAGAAMTGNVPLAAGIGGVMAAGKGGELVQRGLGADVLKYLQQSQ